MKKIIYLLLATVCLMGCQQENIHQSKEALVNKVISFKKEKVKSKSELKEIYGDHIADSDLNNVYQEVSNLDCTYIKDIKNIEIKKMKIVDDYEYVCVLYDLVVGNDEKEFSLPQNELLKIVKDNDLYYISYVSSLKSDKHMQQVMNQLQNEEFIEQMKKEQERVLKENIEFVNQMNQELMQRQQQQMDELNKFTQDSSNQTMQDAQNAAQSAMPFQ